MKTTSSISMALVGLFSLTISSSLGAAPYTAYVMGYFKESPSGAANSHALQLAVSRDGLDWVPLNQNNPVVSPAMGTKALRDPHLFHKADGSWVVVATDNWESESIHIWLSPDLKTFTEKLVKVSTIGHAWAPETFWDPDKKQYGIIWSGKTDRHRIYVTYTADFTTFAAAQVFFDPGYSVIDAHLEPTYQGTNYLYFKREDNSQMYGTKSASLLPGSFDKGLYTKGYAATGSGYWASEAPIVMKSHTSNTWWLWVDCFIPINAEFFAFTTSDIAVGTWSAMNKREYTPPLNSKHATIAGLTEDELQALISKWGLPKWDILKSYRLPRAFVRNRSGVAKISTTPFDPTAGMQWKTVAGLADPAGVSFESVSSPGQYLCQSNDVVSAAASDNSATFKSNATFYKVPGFADAQWSSFRSHARSDRYLRSMADSSLRLDPIGASSTATNKEDATFKLVYASAALGSQSSTELSSRSQPRATASQRVVDILGRFHASPRPWGWSTPKP